MADVSISADDVNYETLFGVESRIAEGNIDAGQALYVNDKTTLSLASASKVSEAECVGIAVVSSKQGQPCSYVGSGWSVIFDDPIFTASNVYAVSRTEGGICPLGDLIYGDIITILGKATSTTTLALDICATGGTTSYTGPTEPTMTNRTLTSSGNMLNTDRVVFLDCSSNDITYTLLAASEMDEQVVYIKRIEQTGYSGIIDGYGSEQVDLELTHQLNRLGVLTIYCDGTKWWIL